MELLRIYTYIFLIAVLAMLASAEPRGGRPPPSLHRRMGPPPGRGGVPIPLPTERRGPPPRHNHRPGPPPRGGPPPRRQYQSVMRPPPPPPANGGNKLVVPFPPPPGEEQKRMERPKTTFELVPSRETGQQQRRPPPQYQQQQPTREQYHQPPYQQQQQQPGYYQQGPVPQPQHGPTQQHPQPQQVQQQQHGHAPQQVQGPVHQQQGPIQQQHQPAPSQLSYNVNTVSPSSNTSQHIIQLHIPPHYENSKNNIIQIHLSSTTTEASTTKDPHYHGSTYKPLLAYPESGYSMKSTTVRPVYSQGHTERNPTYEQHQEENKSERPYTSTSTERPSYKQGPSDRPSYNSDRNHYGEERLEQRPSHPSSQTERPFQSHHSSNKYRDNHPNLYEEDDVIYLKSKYSPPDPLYHHGSKEDSREKYGGSREKYTSREKYSSREKYNSREKYGPSSREKLFHVHSKLSMEQERRQPPPEEILAALGFGKQYLKSDSDKVLGGKFPWEEQDLERRSDELLDRPEQQPKIKVIIEQPPKPHHPEDATSAESSYSYTHRQDYNHHQQEPQQQQQYYYPEPDPIIEIIVQDSNVTLPPVQRPTTIPTTTTPEPVHVFYVRYSTGNKSEVRLENPVPAWHEQDGLGSVNQPVRVPPSRVNLQQFLHGSPGQQQFQQGPQFQQHGPQQPVHQFQQHQQQGPILQQQQPVHQFQQVQQHGPTQAPHHKGPSVALQHHPQFQQVQGPAQFQQQGPSSAPHPQFHQQGPSPNPQFQQQQGPSVAPQHHQQFHQQGPSPVPQQQQQFLQQNFQQQLQQFPQQTTTLRAIIRPDLNEYESSHLHVQFENGPSSSSYLDLGQQQQQQYHQQLPNNHQPPFAQQLATAASIQQPVYKLPPSQGNAVQPEQGHYTTIPQQKQHYPVQQQHQSPPAHQHQQPPAQHQHHHTQPQQQQPPALHQHESRPAHQQQHKQQPPALHQGQKVANHEPQQGQPQQQHSALQHQPAPVQQQHTALHQQHESPQQQQAPAVQPQQQREPLEESHQPVHQQQQQRHQPEHVQQQNFPQDRPILRPSDPDPLQQDDPEQEDDEEEEEFDMASPVWSRWSEPLFNSSQQINHRINPSAHTGPVLTPPPPLYDYTPPPPPNPGGISPPLDLVGLSALGTENHMNLNYQLPGLMPPVGPGGFQSRLGDLPEDVPEDLRRQLVEAGVLEGAEVQVLTLPPSTLSQLGNLQQSAPSPHSSPFTSPGTSMSLNEEFLKLLGSRKVRRVHILRGDEERKKRAGYVRYLLLETDGGTLLLDGQRRTVSGV